MLLKYLRHVSAALAVLAAPFAGASDVAFTGAYDAYRAGDPLRFERAARHLQGHALEPWIDYWRLGMRLEDAAPDDVRAYLEKHRGTYSAELLRADWLKVLGKRADWDEFERELARYPREDLEIRCYGVLSRLVKGDDSAYDEVGIALREPKELPEGCTRLVDTLVKRGHLDADGLWRRVRLLFEHGQITAAKTALGYLSREESPDERALAEAARTPKRLLDRLPARLDKRPVREVAVLAAIRYARSDPAGAAELLEKRLAAKLPDEDVGYLWGRIGFEAARELMPDAIKWYARAGEDTPLSDEQLAWLARAGLRAGRWMTVRQAIDRMSHAASHEPAWIYWYGRSLAAMGEETGSRAHYLRVAGNTDFYGLLASEELGHALVVPPVTYEPADAEVDAARADPGLARALEMIRLGVRTEGVREWLHTIRYYDDAKLLAAAELARRQGVWDRAIQAADRTVRSHNFALRYPTPHQEVFSSYAKTYKLDEAWVYGLVRQESRFIHDARSSAGAAGLMQVMPGTARMVARHIGLRNYRPRGVTDVKTNVTLGTGYLKIVLDQLGHPVLASAAYNAGPSRARRWRDARPLEGAIFAETIPFPETRDYVKKVIANAVYYAAVLEKEPVPLKQRLGMVPARDGFEPPAEEEIPQE